MNIPTILINNMIAEFKAEGYNLVASNITAYDNEKQEIQDISFQFNKKEDKK